MKLTEVVGDLFENTKSDPNVYYVHCLSRDGNPGAGITLEFDKRFNIMKKLADCDTPINEYTNVVLIEHIFSLFTKNFVFQHSSYNSIKYALEDMKKICIKQNINNIAMPRIGCETNKLEWSKVKDIIVEIFNDMPELNITVFNNVQQ